MILNWNGWPDTFQCLRSLRDSPDVGEVWLIDNGSREDHFLEAATIFPGLRFLRLGENYGFAGGYNRALRLAASEGFEFAYLLNNDATARPGFLRAALDRARADHRVAAVGSRVIEAGTSDELQRGEHLSTPIGAGILLRLRACEDHGYFDERFFCYSEETEWAMRMADAGLTVAVCPESVIDHKGEGSDAGDDAVYYKVRNRFLLASLRWTPLPDSVAEDLEYFASVAAEDARRRGRWRRWLSVASGVQDARRRRFGPRSTRQPGPLAIARLLVWSLHASLRDRLAKDSPQGGRE